MKPRIASLFQASLKTRNGGIRSRRLMRLAALVLATGSLATVASAATVTWQNGGVDANWNTPGNWSGTYAAGSDLIFDSATFSSTLSNDGTMPISQNSIAFNTAAPNYTVNTTGGVSVLTVAGAITVNSSSGSPKTQALVMSTALNGAGTRAVTVGEGGKLTLGGTGAAYTHSVNNGTTNFTGLGQVEVLSSSTGTFTIGTANNSIVNMGTLGSFRAEVGQFLINVHSTTTPIDTVTLAGSNTIIASTRLGLGYSGTNQTGAATTLHLGTTNVINTPDIFLVSRKGTATLDFATGLTNPTVTIAGAAGGSSKANMIIGAQGVANTANGSTGILDFTLGTVNATLGTVILGQTGRSDAVSQGSGGTASGTFKMAAGTVTGDTVRLGYYKQTDPPTSSTTATGSLQISGGTMTTGSITVGDKSLNLGAFFTGPSYQSNGTVTVSGTGSLTVDSAFVLGDHSFLTKTGEAASTVAATLTISGGTVTVNASSGITTLNAKSTLTLNGGTLDMKGNAIGTALQQIGSNGGALNFQSGTLSNLGELNGGAILDKSTSGTLNISGTNTYTGVTTITGGTLALSATGSIANSTAVDVGTSSFFDVSALGGGWSMAASQTLKGTGTVTGSIVGGTGIVSPGGTATGSLAVSAAANLAGSTLAIDIDDASTPKRDTLAVTGALDITGATLTLTTTGTPAQAAYVIATYGAGLLTGTFAPGYVLPSGYVLDYAYNSGTAIAVKQSGPGGTYADWLAINGPATGFSTDSDNDGISNGVENILGTNPNTSTAGLTQISATPTSVTFKHTLNPTVATDVTRSYQWSTDLVEWKSSGETNSGGTTATITPSAPVSGVVTVTVAITSGPSAKLFSRLVATQAP